MFIDDIDQKILNIMFDNGRESLLNIKNKMLERHHISMSHTGIRKRIKKLEESKIIKSQVNVKITELNYHLAFILIEMKNYE